MAKAADLKRIALSLPDTVAYPHFDRVAFKVARTFVTLAADGLSANFKFAPDEQELKCLVAPEIFTPVEGGWGRMGFTRAALPPMTLADLEAALAMAHAHAVKKPKARRKA